MDEANDKTINVRLKNIALIERLFFRIMVHHHAESYHNLVLFFKRLIVKYRERNPIAVLLHTFEALATEYYMKRNITDLNA